MNAWEGLHVSMSLSEQMEELDRQVRKIAQDELRAKADNPELPTDFIKTLLISKETDRNLAEPFTFDEEFLMNLGK